MRKGRDGNGIVVENNGENSDPLTSLPVDCLTATDCNADGLYQFEKSPLSWLLKNNYHYNWHERPALQSVAVRQSTGNDDSGPLFSPFFFSHPFFIFSILRRNLFS